GQEKATLPRQSRAIYGLALSPDGKLLATSGGDWKAAVAGEGKLWNAGTLEEIGPLEGWKRDPWSLAFAPDGKLLAGADDSTVKLWQPGTAGPVRTVGARGSPRS